LTRKHTVSFTVEVLGAWSWIEGRLATQLVIAWAVPLRSFSILNGLKGQCSVLVNSRLPLGEINIII
jgi:hypothetical protein